MREAQTSRPGGDVLRRTGGGVQPRAWVARVQGRVSAPQEYVQLRGTCSDISLSRALDPFCSPLSEQLLRPRTETYNWTPASDALKITRLAHSTGPFWGGPSQREGAAPYITSFQLFGNILLGFFEALTWQ